MAGVEKGKCRSIKGAGPAALVAAVAFVLSGCAGAPEAGSADAAAVEAAPRPGIRAGATGWKDHALRLPAGSPVVFWTRPDRLLGAVRALRDWLFAQPAMLGPEGPKMVGEARRTWSKLTTRLGMDLLAAKSWHQLGLDTSRNIYVGLYPAESGQRGAYVDAVDRAVRRQLDVDEQADLADAVDAAGALAADKRPRGVYAAVASATEGVAPIDGVRAVVPIVDRDTFLAHVTPLMQGAHYEAVDESGQAGADADYERHFFYGAGSAWPGVMVRAGQDLAIIDIVEQPPQQGSSSSSPSAKRRQIRGRLDTAISQVDSGRPAAPKLAGGPVAGVGIDQQGAAQLSRLRGFVRACARAERASLAERDEVFLATLGLTLASAANWRVADGRFTGMGYGLFWAAPDSQSTRTSSTGSKALGSEAPISQTTRSRTPRTPEVDLNLTLFGPADEAVLQAGAAPAPVGVDRRGLGASVDLGVFGDRRWQPWIGVDSPQNVVEYFDASNLDPELFALSFPRTLALLLVNADKILAERGVAWLEPILDNRRLLGRLEFASAGIDMRGLRIQPQLVGTVSLGQSEPDTPEPDTSEPDTSEPDTSEPNAAAPDSSGDERRRQFIDVLEQAVSAGVDEDSEDADKEDVIEVGKLAKHARLSASSPVFYYLSEPPAPAYLFFSYGLDRAASRQELDAVVDAREAGDQHDPHQRAAAAGRADESATSIVYARGESVALLSLIGAFDPDLLAPLDVSILAQRLGALTFSVRPDFVDGAQTIRYDVVLAEPPALK